MADGATQRRSSETSPVVPAGTERGHAVAALRARQRERQLETGLASIAGTGSSDVLIGINAAEALGVGDTPLQGSTGVSTLISSAGNTLVGGEQAQSLSGGGNGVG